MEWGPVVEGDFLPTNPVTEDSFAAAGRDIPLLIGSTLNEWNFFPGQGRNPPPRWTRQSVPLIPTSRT